MRSIDEALNAHVSFAVVPDVAADGAFDSALILPSNPPFDYVVHTASPYQLHFADPVRDCLDPAIKGTTGLLKSVHEHAPTVKRVVITSSSAAMLSPDNHPAVYDESCWSNITMEQARDPKYTSPASKVRTLTSPPYLPPPTPYLPHSHTNYIYSTRNSQNKQPGPSSQPTTQPSPSQSSTTPTPVRKSPSLFSSPLTSPSSPANIHSSRPAPKHPPLPQTPQHLQPTHPRPRPRQLAQRAHRHRNPAHLASLHLCRRA